MCVYIRTDVCVCMWGWMHRSSGDVFHLLPSLTQIFCLMFCFLLSSLCPFFFFQTSFFWSSHLSPSVPSLVRFDFFHLPANLYFCFSPCPIITSLNSLHLFFSCYPLPPTLHYFPSFLLSACFVCVCMCMSGCVLARGLPGNVLLHRSLCPINITR